MATIYRIFKKELGGYFNSPQAYIFLIVFLILGPALFFNLSNGGFFKARQASLGGFFAFLPWLFLFFVPAIAMRIWAEEKRSGTDELLMTMPVRDWEVVLGKYFSALMLILMALVLTLPLVYVVRHFADPKTPVDWGPVWCGYVGAFLLGAAMLAIGTWASSLTVNQIIAFIITCAIIFLLILCGLPAVADIFPTRVTDVIGKFSLMQHFISLYRGVLDLSDIVYYLSIIAFFLFLNVRSIESRKWK
jgi:ABC-2 type transport system permease protein